MGEFNAFASNDICTLSAAENMMLNVFQVLYALMYRAGIFLAVTAVMLLGLYIAYKHSNTAERANNKLAVIRMFFVILLFFGIVSLVAIVQKMGLDRG